LSLGQARRVALARAFAIKPNLLVLDEPFVSLDSVLARRLADELVALVEQTHVTTLLVTHDIDEAVRLADHIILLGHRPAEIVGNIDVTLPRRAMTADYAAKTKAEIGAILAENAV
jgi:NitT/TauT family transport system ATP-binding protein